MSINTKLFTDGVCVCPHVGAWSGSEGLSAEDLGLDQADVAEAYKLGSKYLIPEEVMAKFKQVEGKIRNFVDRNSFEFSIGRGRFVPYTKFNEVYDKLMELKAEYGALADSLISNYENYKQQMRPIYQQAALEAFDRKHPEVQEFGIDADPEALRIKREQDKAAFIESFLNRISLSYPMVSSLRRRFYVDIDIYQTAAPEFQQVTAEAVLNTEEARKRAAELAKAQTEEGVSNFVSEVVKTLRAETIEACNRVTSAVKAGKVVRAKTFESLRDFIDRFKSMNFVGDTVISEQLDAVKREFLDVHSNDTLKTNADLQAALTARLQQVTAEATKVSEQDIDGVTSQYVRVVNWQE